MGDCPQGPLRHILQHLPATAPGNVVPHTYLKRKLLEDTLETMIFALHTLVGLNDHLPTA